MSIDINYDIDKHFHLLQYWSLKDLRTVFDKHKKRKMPLFIDKYQFRELFGFSKTNSDLIFANLNSFQDFDKERLEGDEEEKV